MFPCLCNHRRIHRGCFRRFSESSGSHRVLATHERQFTLHVEGLRRAGGQFENLCQGLRRSGIVSGLRLRHSQSPQRYQPCGPLLQCRPNLCNGGNRMFRSQLGKG